jgi:lysyl-tRNA synthetase class 2
MEATLFAPRVGQHYLRTSPEFALKRVVSAGLPRIYEIGPCYRERESGPWHGKEFLMLEWYRVGASLADLMNEVESLIAACAASLSLDGPQTWRRVSVRQLTLETTGLDLAQVSAEELSGGRDKGWDDAFFRRWVEDIEPKLTGPTFLYDWPATQAALAQVRSDKGWPTAQRFEVFLEGVELANAFLELLDSKEQRRRFIESNMERSAANEQPHPLDEAFIEAVGKMPPTAGIALGIDRLVAALCGWDGIHPGRVENP